MIEQEPKYKIKLTYSNYVTNHQEDIKVSSAQVQFWPEYVKERIEGNDRELLRVDLLENSYSSANFVKRLDEENHGPLMDKTLKALK